jgi:hypothetical protein
MRASRAAALLVAVHGSPKEVRAGIHTRCVDVVVLGEVAHDERVRSGVVARGGNEGLRCFWL